MYSNTSLPFTVHQTFIPAALSNFWFWFSSTGSKLFTINSQASRVCSSSCCSLRRNFWRVSVVQTCSPTPANLVRTRDDVMIMLNVCLYRLVDTLSLTCMISLDRIHKSVKWRHQNEEQDVVSSCCEKTPFTRNCSKYEASRFNIVLVRDVWKQLTRALT